MGTYKIRACFSLSDAYAARRKIETQIRLVESTPLVTRNDRRKLQKLHCQWQQCQSDLEYAALEVLEETGLIDEAWQRPEAQSETLQRAIGSLLQN